MIHEAWASAISEKYSLRSRNIASHGGIVRRLGDTTGRLFAVRQETRWEHHHEHRHSLTVAPKLELTVAIHRPVESELMQRLVVQAQRREPVPPGPPKTAPALVPPNATGQENPVVVQRFQPVQREVVATHKEPGPLTSRELPPQPTAMPKWSEPNRSQVPVFDEQGLAERVIQEIDRRGIARRERAVEHIRYREERM